MKILYITTIGATMGFFTGLIRQLMEAGHQVDIACGEVESLPGFYETMGCSVHRLSCTRSPLDRGNGKAIQQIRKLVETERYDIVHCHTPIAAACTRLACRRLRKKGTRVIYTAHGFHFYTGAPLQNWLIYYPVEWLTSWYTDVLITINKDDYGLAQRRFHAKKIAYVPGVGIDTERFKQNGDGKRIREELGVDPDKFLLLSVGELNDNKNHISVIRAIAGLDLVYVVVGEGALKAKLAAAAREAGVHVMLTGYRTDVKDFYAAANAFILPSFREGLNVSLMEAMASGLPCLCGRIRGNVDLVDGSGGITFDPNDPEEIRGGIEAILRSDKPFGEYNQKKIKAFDINAVNEAMFRIYEMAMKAGAVE